MLPYKKMWQELKNKLQHDYNLGRIRKTTLILIEDLEEKYSKETEVSELEITVVKNEPRKRVRRESK